MEQERKPRVAITHGDTNGVGYEVILKTFAEPTILELCTPIVYGSPKVAAYHSKTLGIDTPFTIIANAEEAKDGRLNLLATFDEEVKIDLGMPTPESAQAAIVAVDRALEDWQKGLFDVLVTAPVFKNSISDFNGHTDYIERKLGSNQHGLTILMNDDLRVALVTNNLAIKDVTESITKQKIIDKGHLFFQALRRDLRISNPRIAVLALNPRCGEDGVLGDEEQEIITPAIKELVAEGLQVFGPYASDDFFGRSSYFRFDGVLAMYHDQGQTPFKAVAYENGVRFTTGLPIVRTAPAHGTNFAAAGKGTTDEQSLRNAIYAAIDVWRNRQNYDEPFANPLPKLYHEKRDDSEKVRFSQPRPKDQFRTERPQHEGHRHNGQQEATADGEPAAPIAEPTVNE